MTSTHTTDWDKVAAQMEDDAQRGKLAFVAAALMGAEDVAKMSGDGELVALIRAAINRALQERLRIGFKLRDAARTSAVRAVVGPLPEPRKSERPAGVWSRRAYEDTPQRP